jgi:hypothetical protein
MESVIDKDTDVKVFKVISGLVYFKFNFKLDATQAQARL